MVGGRLRTRHLFILIHNGGEGLKHSGRCEIYVGRPLSQEEHSDSSAKSSKHAASAKHQLYPLKSGSKSNEAGKQLKSEDVLKSTWADHCRKKNRVNRVLKVQNIPPQRNINSTR